MLKPLSCQSMLGTAPSETVTSKGGPFATIALYGTVWIPEPVVSPTYPDIRHPLSCTPAAPEAFPQKYSTALQPAPRIPCPHGRPPAGAVQ